MTSVTVRLLFSLLFLSSICSAKSFKRQSNGGFGGGSSRMQNGQGQGNSPFASMQNGGSNSASGSFSGGAGGGMAGGGSGGGNGVSSGAGQGNGVGPFAVAKGNNGQGGSPFTAAAGGDGSGGAANPFNMNSNGKLSTGPGGLAGGSFAQSLNNGGGVPGQGQSNDLTVDNSRFDTSAYQQMVNQLFSTNKNDQELKDMGSPFDGNSYELPQGQKDDGQSHHNTANDASLGSYADMTAYGASSGQAMGGQGGSKNPSSGNTNFGSGSSNEQVSSNYQNEMARPQETDTETGNYATPFEINNYNTGKSSSSSSASAQNNAKSPFAINNPSSSIGDQNPFKITSGGQNPFDTSSFQAGSGQYQSNTGGLDDFGNVDFGKLSQLSGNNIDNGLPGSLGTANFNTDSGSYSGFQNTVGSGQYGSDASESGGYQGISESQYKTPFESDNDNDLLENPFQSNSNFDTTHQNFKFPYVTNNLQRTNFGANSAVSGYGGGMGSGPAGNPMNQGGNMRGRRSPR